MSQGRVTNVNSSGDHNMNIFEVHRLTTSRIEPMHTVYMASCLKESQALLVQFWALATAEDQDWPTPSEHARVIELDRGWVRVTK